MRQRQVGEREELRPPCGGMPDCEGLRNEIS